jgi:DNA-binding NarL/FixJ family response regulator
MQMKKRFLVVDDHPVFRTGLVALIESDQRYEVVAQAGSSAEAFTALRQGLPDIAIVDISLDSESGLELVHAIKAAYPTVPVLIVSMHDESVYAERALKAGARGMVMKHEEPAEVLNAVRTVLAGKVYLSPRMRDRLLEAFVSPSRDGEFALVDRLTLREHEILEYLGQGYGASEIAEQLSLSVKTVHSHQENLKEKLQFPGTSELRRFAVSWYRAAHP